MNTTLPVLTGIGSVTPYGPLAGLISAEPLEPGVITAWATPGLRRAFLVEPFRPASIVPGIEDPAAGSSFGVGPGGLVAGPARRGHRPEPDGSLPHRRLLRYRLWLRRTHRGFLSKRRHKWLGGTDPITFPETLSNAPASSCGPLSRSARTQRDVSSKSFAAESALLQAASLLRHGQADMAIVLAGDTLTQAVYEWYEAAHLLSPACFSNEPMSAADGFIPGEGVVAMVLEPDRRSGSAPLCDSGRGTLGGARRCQALLRQIAAEIVRLDFTICAGNGAPCAYQPAADLPGARFGRRKRQ